MANETQVLVLTFWKRCSLVKSMSLMEGISLHVIDAEDEELEEESVILGRHPNCDILLEHPSVSKRHLRIDTRISSKRIVFATDLNSTHGTWVSGRRLEPNVQTRINEFDTLTIGKSKTNYKLYWIPMSKFFDTVVHDSPVEDQIGISSENMKIGSVVCSTLSGTEDSSGSSESLGNGDQSPPLYPMNRSLLRPLPSPTRRRLPSKSRLITSGSKSASRSWFRGGLLCSDINIDNNKISSSNKERYTADSSKLLRDLQKARSTSLKEAKSFVNSLFNPQKQTKREKKPFQSLSSSALPRKSSDSKTTAWHKRSKGTIQSWSLVVDTTTLLADNSRRALQLLEGLEGTQLIIPIAVIKNLAYLNHEVSFLGERTELSLILNWIKDCLAEKPWWVHVHDPAEEGLLATPTLPQAGSSAFSSLEPPPQLFFPSVADHILDCAISFKRNRYSHGHLVLLSSDSTLKAKAMAVGMACKTAEEFNAAFFGE